MRKRFKSLGAIALSAAMVASIIPADTGKAYTPGNYSYFDDYSIGWSGGIRVYKGSSKGQSVKDAGLTVYDTYADKDNPFVSEISQAWDADTITLTQQVSFTTSDGVVHPIENMLTGFDFIADPTAIDNTGVDGKLYVYGTTEGFSYGKMSRDNPEVTANPGDALVGNKYQNHSLTILSTSDMVNWTDEGFMDSLNLTNLPSTEEDDFVKSGITKGPSWAPSGLKYDLDGKGNYKYYLFYTNGGSTGYVMSDSPTGPWVEPEGGTIFSSSTPNCSDCSVCFDPAVLLDDKGDGYVYFGGLSRTSGRACKVKFDSKTGRVSRDGDPVKLPTYAMFEDNEINQFNGKYYYSYCTDFNDPQTLTKKASIAVYVSSDPLNVSFDVNTRPKNQETEAFTDDDGTYRHFLGTVLDNPSNIFGEGYNNHHHMQEYKGHYYIFYHSTVLHNTLHRTNKQYRNLHVDEITVDESTDQINALNGDTIATYEGPEQIEAFNPFYDSVKKQNYRYINATTSSSSAGVNSTRDDVMVEKSKSGSPMVLDNIDTGDWIRIQGVDFGDKGVEKISAEISSQTDQAAIEMFIDSPTDAGKLVATIPVKPTGGDDYDTLSADVKKAVTGKHDVYFVFRGSGYKVASWRFDNADTLAAEAGANATPAAPTPANGTSATAAPTATPTAAPTTAPAVTDAPDSVDTSKTYKVGSNTYKITDAKAATVNYVAPAKKSVKSVSVPATVKIEGITYKVTGIAAKAFKGCSKLSKVTVGKNVKMIGAKAFNGCKSLKKINVKSTVLKKVGAKAFSGINAKAAIKVPKKQLKAYKKVLKGKGQGKKVRIK